MKRTRNANLTQFLSVVKPMMMKSLVVAALAVSLYSCSKSSDDSGTPTPAAQTLAQIVYTSDLHYGISRTFRGATTIAAAVNQAMIQQINAAPSATFPSDGTTTSASTAIEQRAFVSILQAHPNIKAYFHGNDNKNEFYVYKGPDNNVSLKVFRVDSPMKGSVSGIDAADGIGDETKISFQVIAIDGASKTLTVRECFWNTAGATSPLVWGANSTISLN